MKTDSPFSAVLQAWAMLKDLDKVYIIALSLHTADLSFSDKVKVLNNRISAYGKQYKTTTDEQDKIRHIAMQCLIDGIHPDAVKYMQ